MLALSGSFDALTDSVMFASWIFYGLTTASIFVFRRRLPDADRPYRAWGYPVVPVLFLVVTAGLSAALVVADLLRRGRRAAPAAVNYRLVLLTFAIFTAYVFLLPVLGYRVATVLFVGGVHAMLEPPRGARAWALVIASGVATMLVSYYVFERYLHVLLPRGWLTGF